MKIRTFSKGFRRTVRSSSEVRTPVTLSKPVPETPATAIQSPFDFLRNRSRRTKWLTLGTAIAALAIWFYFSGRVTTDDAQVDCHITAVAPQVPGYVVKVNVDDNVSVKQGDVLVQIDPREYQAQVDQAEAELDFAEAAASCVVCHK